MGRGAGKQARRLGKNNTYAKCVAFAPDGKTLAWGDESNRPSILWDLKTGMPLAEWHFPDKILALAYSADGRHLLLSSENGRVYVLHLAPPPPIDARSN
jgi:WD40 repeat protein